MPTFEDLGDGLVDLHCHVLPGLDDGPVAIEESLAMAKQAATGGIDVICATPHIRSDHPFEIDQLAARTAALNHAIAEAGIAVRVAPGGELAAPMASYLEDDELHHVSLGGAGRWLLVEPAPGAMDDALEHTVDRLHSRGVRCVIAHPERHAGADAADRLAGLVGRGALIQVTAAFLVGHGAAPTILDWASRGLVHLIGSDSHSSRVGRPVAVADGLAVLAGVPRLAAHVDWIGRLAPRDLLAGRDPVVPF